MNRSDHFTAFFKAIHGHDPFPWQSRLSDEVATQGWPSSISLPTASGKTSVIDIAVHALAFNDDEYGVRKTPMRILFVIDRRLVVDEVTRHAQELRDALSNPRSPVVEEV